VRQRRYGGGRRRGRNLGEASKTVAAVNVHGAGAADPLAAGAAEGEGGIDLVFDLDERVQDHGPALLQVDLVVLQLRFRRVLRVPPVDLEGFQGGCVAGLRLRLLGLGLRRVGSDECQLERRRRRHPLRCSLQQPRRRHRKEKVGSEENVMRGALLFFRCYCFVVFVYANALFCWKCIGMNFLPLYIFC